ncbi:LuxR C-terminal-related transcriptional regulator [Paraconexibacter sp.]|uniref:LuxR C-terminal-related transcriptional regulator n=1 Tax=Paraconexibacter sp. TaxID=2949640 RepID=UPI003562F6B5
MARLMLIDDHGAVRSGLQLLAESAGHEVVATAATVEAGRRKLLGHRPDLAVVDEALPDGRGHELIAELRHSVDTRFLLYTGLEDPKIFVQCLTSGADGHALKGGSAEELLGAIDNVLDGMNYFDPRIGQALRTADVRTGRLRPREREVLALVAAGQETQEIADRLVLSPETVRSHVRNLLERLGAHTRAQAVAIALTEGELVLSAESSG